MRILRAILIFYQKLIVPAWILSVLLGLVAMGLLGEFFFKTLGISYIIAGLLFHYFIYEIRNYNEYYFYHNIGLSRFALWIITFTLNLVIGLILMSL